MTRRLLGVVGWPVAHSLSPAMQGAALSALGLDWEYRAIAVSPAQLSTTIAEAPSRGFVGLNITVPHKQAVVDLCEPDPLARRVGAVNTLLFVDGADRPRGLNTDVHGFRMLLAEAGLDPRGMRVALLGAGGAASAVALCLLEGGADLVVVSRSLRPLSIALPHPPMTAWSDDTLRRILPDVGLLVDATPRGLADDPVTEADLLPGHAMVVDLVVRRTTPLLEAARRRGLRASGGAPMLLHQGAAALEAWTGRTAPVAEMRQALLGCLS